MNLFTAMLTTIALLPSASTEAQTMDITRPEGQAQRSAQRKVESEQQSQLANEQGTTRPSGELQQRIAPGPARLTDEVLFGDVWRRPELSPHDRSLVTIAVSIATGKTTQLAGHLGRALANGYSLPRPRASWRIWRFTADGRARSRHWRSTSRCTARGRSTPPRCVPWARDFQLPSPTRHRPKH